MTARLAVTAAPVPLEEYAAQFDDLFTQRSQREGFRRYLEGLLLPAERNKTLTGLANTAPVVGAQHARAQGLQWFLSESTWAASALNARRLALLGADPTTAPDAQGVLVIDEHGDRKWGHQTAVLAVYSIHRDFLAVRSQECQDLASDGVHGQHSPVPDRSRRLHHFPAGSLGDPAVPARRGRTGRR